MQNENLSNFATPFAAAEKFRKLENRLQKQIAVFCVQPFAYYHFPRFFSHFIFFKIKTKEKKYSRDSENEKLKGKLKEPAEN